MEHYEAWLLALLRIEDARREMAPPDCAAWSPLYSRLETVVHDLTGDADGSTAPSKDLCEAIAALLQNARDVATKWRSRGEEGDDELRALEKMLRSVERRVRDERGALEAIGDGDVANALTDIAEQLRSGLKEEKELALTQLWEDASRRGGHIGTVAQEDVIPALVQLLRDGTSDQKEAATLTVWALALASPNVPALVEADVIKALVVLVQMGNDMQKLLAAWALRTLVVAMDEIKMEIPLTDGLAMFASLEPELTVAPLVQLLRDGSATQVHQALWALSTIADSHDEAVSTVIVDAGVIELVVNAYLCASPAPQKLWALRLLHTLAASTKTKIAITDAQAIEPLAKLMRNDSDLRTLAMKALARLANDTESYHRQMRNAGTVGRLFAIARDGTDSEKTVALNTLVSLANVQESRVEMVETGALSVLDGIFRTGPDVSKTLALLVLLRVASDDCIGATTDTTIVELVVQLTKNGTHIHQEFAISTLERFVNHAPSRAKALSAGVLAPLVEQLRSESTHIQLKAARAIGVIIKEEPSQYQELVRVGGIEPLVALSRCGTDAQKQVAIPTLLQLSSQADVKQEIMRVDPAAVTHAGAVDTLVELLRSDSADSLKALAAEALSEAATDETAAQVTSAGAIEPLVDLACGDHGHIEVALRALYQITLLDTNCGVTLDEPIGPCVGRLWNDSDVPQPVRSDTTAPSVSARCLHSLVTLLHGDDHELIEHVAGVLLNLSLHDDNKAEIAQARCLSPLLALVQGGTVRQKILSLALLRNLAAGDNDAKSAMLQAGAVDVLVGALHSDFHDRKETAIVALWNLADNRDAAKRAIASAGAVPLLVALVQNGTQRQKEVAAGALWGLALASRNKSVIVDAGGIAPLVELVRDGTDAQKDNAAGALCSLAAGNEVIKLAIEEAGGISPLAALAREGSRSRRVYATWALEFVQAREAEAVARRNAQFAAASVVVAGVAWIATTQLGKP